MAAALDAAHEAGVVHRDFKSENVFLVPGRREGETRVVVTDFGMARAMSRERFVVTMGSRELMGTPAYMAPEQVEGGEVTGAADLYAFGIVLYEMVTGCRPFDAETPLALLDQKSAGKKLMLVTNSEWAYTKAMMTFAFDPFLGGKTWRELFDVVIVGARKPEFFSGHAPFFEVATEDGLLRPDVGKIVPGKWRVVIGKAQIADGAALMTQTKVVVKQLSGDANLVGNPPLERAMHDNLLRLGGPGFDAADHAFAREIPTYIIF